IWNVEVFRAVGIKEPPAPNPLRSLQGNQVLLRIFKSRFPSACTSKIYPFSAWFGKQKNGEGKNEPKEECRRGRDFFSNSLQKKKRRQGQVACSRKRRRDSYDQQGLNTHAPAVRDIL